MNKKIYALVAILSLSIFIGFTSCGSDDDDNKSLEEWKEWNETILKETINKGGYTRLVSNTGDGEIYYKTSNSINTKLLEITDVSKTPLFTDSVICRYEGWFYDKERKKVIFDTTEGDNNNQERGFHVNGVIQVGRIYFR